MIEIKKLQCPTERPQQKPSFVLNYDNIDLFYDNLKSRLTQYENCEITWNFSEEVKNLSNQYYGYFDNPSYILFLRTAVDIQSILELSDKFLNDFEAKTEVFYNTLFTLRSLGKEIEKLELAVNSIMDEVKGFWKLVQTVDQQNLNISKILRDIWKVIEDLKDSKYTLSNQHRNYLKNTQSERKINLSHLVLSSPNSNLDNLMKISQDDSVYFTETVRQIQILNMLLSSHKYLLEYQPMFSFYLILLLNKRELSSNNDDSNKFDKSNKCFQNCFKPSTGNHDDKKGKVKEATALNRLSELPSNTFNYLEKQLMVLGDKIFQLIKDIREFQCAALRREEILLETIRANRMILIRCLSKIHNLTMAFEQLDHCNDTLIGKLTKTRPNCQTILNHINMDEEKFMNLLKAYKSHLSDNPQSANKK